MLYQIKEYIKFLLKSSNQHGIHSPFVYNLVTKCFYDKAEYSDYQTIIDFKKYLKEVDLELEVTDFGAGSKKLKSASRAVSNMAKHVAISNKNAKLLFRISKYFKPNTVLELGTSLGFATQALALGNPNANIISIEGCPEISAYTKTQLKLQKLNNIEILTDDFSKVIPKIDIPKFDLIFFDGNHQKEATLKYFEMLLPKAHNDSLFIFDDIYWSKGMTEAWEIIKHHPKVTVTIDTFSWGMAFFRKEQLKEDFKIRI